MTLAAMTGLLLVGCAFRALPDFMKWNASLEHSLSYFALQIPSYLPVVIPVALLISVLFVLGFFHRNQEITAMRAAGLSIFRITRPLWFAGGVLSVLLLALNASLVPLSTEKAQQIMETAEFDYLVREAQRAGKSAGIPKSSVLLYTNNSARRIWGINQFSGYTGRGFGINIHQNDENGLPVEAWLARYAEYNFEKKQWMLEDGRHLVFKEGRLREEPKFQKLVHPQLTEDPRLMLAMGKKPHNLSIYEIKGVLDQVGADTSRRMASYSVQYHYVLASPFCCLIVIGLAVPFAVTGVRVNPMVGVSKSLVLFAVYYLVSNVCALLGAQQNLSPMFAAWLPNLLMFALAVWLCRKVN
jgi:lipopolysaccharide export system permease protein